MVRIGDRYVPVHEAGGLVAISQAHRDHAIIASGVHNLQSMGEADLNHAMRGMDHKRR